MSVWECVCVCVFSNFLMRILFLELCSLRTKKARDSASWWIRSELSVAQSCAVLSTTILTGKWLCAYYGCIFHETSGIFGDSFD